MLRMGLAPCAPFNVTNNLMVEAARLARKYAILSLQVATFVLQVTAQDTTLPAMGGQPYVPHTRSMHQVQPAFARSMHAQQQQRVASRF
jgi:hypothetical protein